MFALEKLSKSPTYEMHAGRNISGAFALLMAL
jgi:hypothetical protein